MQPDTYGFMLRPIHPTHSACLAYDTYLNECAAFVFKSDAASFKVIHGMDPETIAKGTLNNATPTLLVSNSETVVSGNIKGGSFGSSDTINIRPEAGNEINFGGSSTDANIYFGYRSYQGRPIPTT